MRVKAQSVISMQCFSIFSTHVTMASYGEGQHPENKVKCNDFELLAVSDAAEACSNSALSEQLSDASSLRLRSFTFCRNTTSNS